VTSAIPGGLAGDRRREERLGFAFLLLAMVLLHVGIGNAYVPLEDEGTHVLQAIAVWKGQPSTNLYYHLYSFVFTHLTTDPIQAHLVLRTLASFAAASAMYLVLTSFRGITPAASTIASIAWGASRLCTPPLQTGTSGVLSLALVMFPLALVLRRPGWPSIALFMLACYWAAQIRPEYYAPLIAVPAAAALFARRRRRAERAAGTPGARPRLVAGALAVGTLLLSVFYVATGPRQKKIGLDAYLLLGLGQCYAAYYRDRHPDEVFDPMTEYQPLLDRVFGHPKTFTGALANNPGEAAKYFVVNSMENLSKLPRAVLASKNRVMSGLVLLLLCAGGALGVIGWRRARSSGRSARPRDEQGQGQEDDLWRLALLVATLSASSCAIVLLVPGPRYWLSWAPLLYLWLAWSVDNLLAASRSPKVAMVAVPCAALVFGYPMFPRIHSNQATVRAVRAAGVGLDHKPVLAGNWVLPLTAFAFGDQGVSVNAYDGLSLDDLRAGRYDFFFFDAIDHTTMGHDNAAFLHDFQATPERFGYRLLGGTAEEPPIVYAKLR